jgi:hypothetical protein
LAFEPLRCFSTMRSIGVSPLYLSGCRFRRRAAPAGARGRGSCGASAILLRVCGGRRARLVRAAAGRFLSVQKVLPQAGKILIKSFWRRGCSRVRTAGVRGGLPGPGRPAAGGYGCEIIQETETTARAPRRPRH